MTKTSNMTASAALAILATALLPASLQAKVIQVHPKGAIQTIQNGVDAAAPGDTVLVLPGTYVHSEVMGYWPGAVHIWSSKSGLKLKAVGPVKLVGPGGKERKGTGIQIDANNVSVEGFDISGFGRGIVAGVQTEGTQTQITRNTISDCTGTGIELRGAGNYEVAHNTVVGGSMGILLQPPSPPDAAANPQHHIHHNRVNGAQSQGIMLATAPGSMIEYNVCDNNLWEGIYVAGSANCNVTKNQTDSNGWAGIEVGGSLNCVVTGNVANNNAGYHEEIGYAGWGIYVWNSCGSTFERNVAQGNLLWDLFAPDWDTLSPPTCNTYHNNRADTASPSLAVWGAE